MKPEPTDLEYAAALLQGGGLVAFPTETVYGLGADARNEAAVRCAFTLKGRPRAHPVIVHLASAEQLAEWAVDMPDAAYALAARFWPGPLTLILKRRENVPDAVTGGQPTVGLRVPGHPVALALLERFGGGVAAPSANRFGRVSPTTAAHVHEEFGGRLEVLDGGPCSVGLESTILDLSGNAPRVLRPGAVSAADLEMVLHQPVAVGINVGTDVATATSPRVSGSLKSHYAPETETRLVDDASAHSLGTDAVLARRPQASVAARWLTLPGDPDAYGQGLYAALRDLDASGCARILIERPPNTPAWAAVRDRLGRAALPLAETTSV